MRWKLLCDSHKIQREIRCIKKDCSWKDRKVFRTFLAYIILERRRREILSSLCRFAFCITDINLLVHSYIRIVKLVKIYEGFAVVKYPGELHRFQQWPFAINLAVNQYNRVRWKTGKWESAINKHRQLGLDKND